MSFVGGTSQFKRFKRIRPDQFESWNIILNGQETGTKGQKD